MYKRLDQALILLLMADAAIVAVGVSSGANVWPWVTAYWVVLTAKNAVGWMAGRKKK